MKNEELILKYKNRLDRLDEIENENGFLTDEELNEYANTGQALEQLEPQPKEKYQFKHKKFKKWRSDKMNWRKRIGLTYYTFLIITPMIFSFVYLWTIHEADWLTMGLLSYSMLMIVSSQIKIGEYNRLVENAERGDAYVKALEDKIDSLEETIDLLKSKI